MTPSDVKIVAENIDDFVEVPNGVGRLRSAILTLAISGKFAPPGSASWGSSTLGEVCSVRKGKKPELYDTEDRKMLPYLEAKFIRGTKPAKFAKISDKNSVAVTEDDLIIICDGSNSGEFFTGVKGVLASTMGVLNYEKKIVSKEYLEVFLESNFELFNKARKGAAIPHLDFNLFNSLAFSLPSVEEQKRIVKRVEGVMKQLDELETKKRERDETRTRLARSAMQSLGRGESRIAFGHLAEIVRTPDDIKELEDALLSLAVSGRLSLQDTTEGSAQALYAKIQSKKAGMKLKTSTPIEPGEIPFEVPANWIFIRLGDVVSILGDGLHGTPNYSSNGDYYFVNGNNLVNGRLEFKGNTKRVAVDEYNKHKKVLTNNTVLVSINGTLGNFAFYEGEKIILGKSACYFNLFEGVNKYYVGVLIRSPYFLKYAVDVASQTTIKNISLKSMRLLPIPLPPLAEQGRIVKKVEEVMSLVSKLRQLVAVEK